MHQSSFRRSYNRPPLPPQKHNQTQFSLPGDFYGPPQNHGDRRRCGCCKIFSSIILFIILVIIIFILTVLWFVLRPEGPDFTVESATLSYFNHLPATKDQYKNFMVETRFRIRNPNKKIEFHYELRELESHNSGGWWYLKNMSSLPSTIEQGTGNSSTALFKVTFQSETAGVKIVDDRKNTTKGELGNVDLGFYGRIRMKVWKIKTGRFPLKIKCDLLVPVEINGKMNSTGSFMPTDCKVRYYY